MLKSSAKISRLLLNQVLRFTSSHPANSLSDCGQDDNFVGAFLKKHPKISEDSVASVVRNFVECEIPLDIVPGVLNKCPDLTRVPPKRFNENLRCWQTINLGQDFLELITINPSVLFLSKNHMESRYADLVEIFGKRSLGKILLSSTLVLTEPIEDVRSKVDYLEKQLNYSRAEVIKTKALRCSIKHIKLRIEFLKKAGVFKVPNPKTLAADKQVNPMISKILFLNNHDFANQLAGVSLLEFNVFVDMMENEEDSDLEDDPLIVIDEKC